MGGVLIEDPAPGMVRHYLDVLNVKETPFTNAFNRYAADWQKGKITEEKLWKGIASDLGVPAPSLESLWLDGLKKSYFERKNMFELIRSLRNSGYKAMILSNTEISVMNFLIDKLSQHFDDSIFSCEIGMVKPDKEIYEYVLSRTSSKPEEVIFIDDKEGNVMSAREIGIEGIHFTSESLVISKISELVSF